MPEPKYPEAVVKLTGEDGNAVLMVARTQKALKQAGVPQEELDEFRNEALSGDYSTVLSTCDRWATVI